MYGLSRAVDDAQYWFGMIELHLFCNFWAQNVLKWLAWCENDKFEPSSDCNLSILIPYLFFTVCLVIIDCLNAWFQVLKKEFPRGVDIIYESVGGEMFDLCLNALAVHGRLVVIGMISQVRSSAYDILFVWIILCAVSMEILVKAYLHSPLVSRTAVSLWFSFAGVKKYPSEHILKFPC